MKTKINKTYFNWILQTIILVLTLVFLYNQLFHKHDLTSLFSLVSDVINKSPSIFDLTLLLFLMPVNLLLESYKWQILIKKLENVSLANAFKAVLTGLSVSIFLPNRVGDYLGRVFILKKADRLQATLATMLGSLAQLLTTLIFGLGALAYALHIFFDLTHSFTLWAYIGVVAALLLVLAGMLFIYLNFSSFSAIIKKISGKEYPRIKKYSQVFSWYDARELFQILLISMVRYLLFSFQFYLLLLLLNIPVSYPTAMILISLIYLIMTIIPTIAMTELGVRSSVSLYVFAYYFKPYHLWNEPLKQSVVAASALLWILNLAVPALAGIFFIFKLRFFRNNHANSH